MEQVILVRIGEIYLKGRNKAYFEKVQMENIKKNLADIPCVLVRNQNRFFVEKFSEENTDRIMSRLKNVFGLHSISLAYKVSTNYEEIAKLCVMAAPESGTFRITVNRADKTLDKTSVEIAKYLGGEVLKSNPDLSVDLYNPDREISVDIRENHTAYVFMEKVFCRGGMPIGSSGNGLALLSGGIDSPVAVYKMAKRGMKMYGLHFHSFPYTSLKAKEKVIELAQKLADYCGEMKLFVVSFTEIQQEIHRLCPAEFMITIMRRIMMRIAERIALANFCGSITTGESLAQVASQTQESILVTNNVIKKLPVFRPLIGMDKEEIIAVAKDIGTFDTSILPYEDCCTVFLPKNPVIKPKLDIIEKAESKLDVEGLIEKALENIEVIEIAPIR